MTRNALGGIKFWPKPWVRHFRTQCVPLFPLNYFVAPRLPADARVVIFPATPNPLDAILGRWVPEEGARTRGEHLMRAIRGPRYFKKRFRHLRRFLLPTCGSRITGANNHIFTKGCIAKRQSLVKVGP